MIDHEKNVQQTYLNDQLERSILAKETFNGYKNKVKGRLYGEKNKKEKDGEWEKFLDSIIIELEGIGANSINYWALIGKLNSLKRLSYDYFRKTIFECMNLVGSLEQPNELS